MLTQIIDLIYRGTQEKIGLTLRGQTHKKKKRKRTIVSKIEIKLPFPFTIPLYIRTISRVRLLPIMLTVGAMRCQHTTSHKRAKM